MCTQPIWIRNRRYYDKKRPVHGFHADDDHRTSFALYPMDIARQWLAVPCGKCEDCLRRLRNNWYVRLERELDFCKTFNQQAVFVTITIAPKWYDFALADPSAFMRKFNERIRHCLGSSVKHFYVQEFGEHPQTGGSNRLHFHGFIFNFPCSYNRLREVVSDFGFIWLGNATLKRARYVVKYVCKNIKAFYKDGTLIPEILCRKYTRKFVSPHVGDWLGRFARPSFFTRTWSYTDYKTHITYNYTIPRYYDRYLSESDKFNRALLSADAYARFSSNALVKYIVSFLSKRTFSLSTLSSREKYTWINKKSLEFQKVGFNPFAFNPPVWLSPDILEYWKKVFNLDPPKQLLTKFRHLWENNLSLVTS
uniref:Replication initiator protein n=1 Tax=Dulem virus 212 TaxID=3145689 RepID=A0AAU8B5X8_9VIRU